jgi:hypothetical protein
MLCVVLGSNDVERLRLSHAMAPLPARDVDRLLAACAELTREREQIRNLLARLPGTVAELRTALNELHRLVC